MSCFPPGFPIEVPRHPTISVSLFDHTQNLVFFKINLYPCNSS